MADFTSGFWNWYIIVLTVASILACFLLIRWLSSAIKPEDVGKEMDHVWDESLVELNNPLPRWWLNMFYITLYFSVGYLILYPGLGTFKGLLDWTSTGQYEREVAIADAKYGPLFKKFQEMPIVAVAADPEARRMGERLFVNYCATCHGSDARGARGFPNLRDNDWLYGDSFDTVMQSIAEGRRGAMPVMVGGLDDGGINNLVAYVQSMSGQEVDAGMAAEGKKNFDMLCVACHGVDGSGNQALGAPRLNDDIWLYGGETETIKKTVTEGRNGNMPVHKNLLSEDRRRLIAAYVLSLSK